MAYMDPRREAARAFFESLQKQLLADEVMGDKLCVRQLLEKAKAEQATRNRKRFDAEGCFRSRLLFPKMDDVLWSWMRQREIGADPFRVLRFEGTERGPTQHETAIGPSLAMVQRAFDRLVEAVPEVPDSRAAVLKDPTKAIAPAFRLQHPLPFGAAGEVIYAANRRDIERGIYRVAMYAATGGDLSRGWKYECGVLIAYCDDRVRTVLGEDLWEAWPEVQERIWEAGRVWAIVI